MADICSKWRQTALIQLPVTAETLSTVVDKCYTKAHLNTVHFFMWTIKLWFPDIFWVYRHLFTNSMAWGGHISCQGQSKRYFCYLPCMLFYFRQWLNWITEEFEALQKMCVIQTVIKMKHQNINLSIAILSGNSAFFFTFLDPISPKDCIVFFTMASYSALSPCVCVTEVMRATPFLIRVGYTPHILLAKLALHDRTHQIYYW